MIYTILILLALFVLPVGINFYRSNSIRRKKRKVIANKWGKPTDDYRNISLISAYLKATAQPDDLTSGTTQDVDMDRLFAYVDRTNSKPGQQFLYKKLHQPETDLQQLLEMDGKVEKLSENSTLQQNIELELTALNGNNAYYLHQLFTKEQQQPFGKILSFYISVSAIVMLVTATLLTIWVNQFYFLLLLGMVIFNLVIHYKSKLKIYAYTHSLPQLFVLIKVAGRLLQKFSSNKDDVVKNSLNEISDLKRTLSFINFESKVAADKTDILYTIWELIKTILLLEPLMFLMSIKRVNQHRAAIERVFNYVAEMDMLISIQSVRNSLPYYCKPEFTDDVQMRCDGLFHPLVENCIPNSIQTQAGEGVLITGSNMSGKTTFIRAAAINMLLSQALFTSCCQRYKAPLLKLHTSIKISDDLNEQKSYFKAEALLVLQIIEACERAQPLKSMVIIDEIFKGTNTIERVAAAKAVLAYLAAQQNFVFVSTHDLELAELLGSGYAIYSFEESVADTRLVFDYKMKPGLLKNKNGIAILNMLGYPAQIVADAGKVSERLQEKYRL